MNLKEWVVGHTVETITESGLDPRDVVYSLIQHYDIDPLDVYEGEELEYRLKLCK